MRIVDLPYDSREGFREEEDLDEASQDASIRVWDAMLHEAVWPLAVREVIINDEYAGQY